MLSLVKMPFNNYSWTHDNRCIFIGKYTETLAYGHWSFGIEKEEIHKALKSLTKIDNRITFKENKVISQDTI